MNAYSLPSSLLMQHNMGEVDAVLECAQVIGEEGVLNSLSSLHIHRVMTLYLLPLLSLPFHHLLFFTACLTSLLLIMKSTIQHNSLLTALIHTPTPSLRVFIHRDNYYIHFMASLSYHVYITSHTSSCTSSTQPCLQEECSFISCLERRQQTRMFVSSILPLPLPHSSLPLSISHIRSTPSSSTPSLTFLSSSPLLLYNPIHPSSRTVPTISICDGETDIQTNTPM